MNTDNKISIKNIISLTGVASASLFLSYPASAFSNTFTQNASNSRAINTPLLAQITPLPGQVPSGVNNSTQF